MEITHTRTHTHTKKENIESTKRDQITNSICLVKSINGFELPVDDTCIALELQNPGECQIREKYVETNRHFINGHRILRPQRFLKCSLAYCSQALAGLPTFCPITFHLFASYSLIASRSFMDSSSANSA